jgi:exodeoxyribonuclease-5
MILTNRQNEGLKIALTRYKNHEKYTVISGYAGTGKSTLVKFIIEALDVDEDRVCFACFTGKAAQVLLKKGNKNVKTLHKLLYKSFPKPDGTFGRIPVESIPYDIIIVDEVSMAPKSLMTLLATYNVHIICLGDPFQLPPVDKDEDNHLLDHPHIFLDEIMRQAQESEIIRLTMDIRAGKSIKPIQGNEVIVSHKDELNTGMLQWADQVICATNATRVALNTQMRQLSGLNNLKPQNGDKIVCLRNYWDSFSDDGEDPLINGTIGWIDNCFTTFIQLPRWAEGQQIPILNCNFKTDSNSIFSSLDMDRDMIITGESSLNWKTSFKLSKNPKTRLLVPKQFTYGYAITCHKAQGSEFEKVLVVEEKFPFDREEHARWLYTAATRASEKLVIIQKD